MIEVEISREIVDKNRDDWNMACLQVGIPSMSTDTCARLLAVLYVHGNNEEMTHNPKFLADLRYIQMRFGFTGGEKPDMGLVSLVKTYITELEIADNNAPQGDALFSRGTPQWAKDLFGNNYGIKLIN